MLKNIILIIFVLAIYTSISNACSSIWINNGKYFLLGANFDADGDWSGLIFINYSNVVKKTDFYNTGNKDKTWVSKYGSITFNLVCQEYAQYGMNEEGLIVSTVSDPNTKGPKLDDRPSLIGNFWVQYILDNCKNVIEVKNTLNEIRIVPGSDRYIICDKNNHSIVIEFQNHRVTVYENESLPITVITNQTYLNCLKHHENNTLPENNVFDYVTTKRFVVASQALKNYRYKKVNDGICKASDGNGIS